MKKLVVTILGISVIAIGGSATVAGAPNATRPPEASNPTLSAEMVNDISVPLDVLLYVQTEYQGYAVTNADKVVRNGKQSYRLKVDRNDAANDGNSFYLLYDMSWKLLGEEKVAQPTSKAEPKKPEQKQSSTEKPNEEQPKPDDKPTQPATTPNETTTPPTTADTNTTQPSEPPANGGDGSGTAQDGQTTTTTNDGGTTGN